MNQNLFSSGVRLLNALSNHADVIMQVYLTNTLDERQCSAQVIENLKSMGVLWQPESGGQWRLKGAVRALLESSLQDERKRQLDANIGSALGSLKTLAAHYKEALQHGRFVESQKHLSDLSEHVYTLTESLGNSVRTLFGRISNEFGYVSSIDAKIRENQLAQEQVSQLLAQLELFHFDELAEESGSYRELRHLLVVTLQQGFARATRELSVVQARLLELMGRFREFKGRTRLLKGFMLHMEQQPDFVPTDYTKATEVPWLFNQAPGLIRKAAVDVRNVEQEDELHSLVASVKQVNHLHQPQPRSRASQDISVAAQDAVILNDDGLKAAVEDYFCRVIESGVSLSALEYLHQAKLDYDAEVWLYQVIGGYQGLSSEEQRYFAIEPSGQPHPVFSGNFVIEDVALGLR